MTRFVSPRALFAQLRSRTPTDSGRSRNGAATMSVVVGGVPVSIAVRRLASARRLTLRVSGATGTVRLTAPAHTSESGLRRFVDGQTAWLASRLATIAEPVPFDAGATIPIRGVPHAIVHAPGRGKTHLVGEDGPRLMVAGDASSLRGRVRRFLQAEAAQDLGAASRRYADRLGVRISRVSLRDTKSRWGSCSSQGALSFSWRLILAPPLVLDYLAAHEVAHLREMNHSARYWATLRELCPGTDEAEAWLKRHGTSLHRYG